MLAIRNQVLIGISHVFYELTSIILILGGDLSTGGCLWFINLIEPDPYMLLSAMQLIMMLLLMRVCNLFLCLEQVSSSHIDQRELC